MSITIPTTVPQDTAPASTVTEKALGHRWLRQKIAAQCAALEVLAGRYADEKLAPRADRVVASGRAAVAAYEAAPSAANASELQHVSAFALRCTIRAVHEAAGHVDCLPTVEEVAETSS